MTGLSASPDLPEVNRCHMALWTALFRVSRPVSITRAFVGVRKQGGKEKSPIEEGVPSAILKWAWPTNPIEGVAHKIWPAAVVNFL